MRFSTLLSPSRLALIVSLPMMWLFLVASAVFAKVVPQVLFIAPPSASEASISANEGGHITGTITDGNGSPLPNTKVVAFHDEGLGESYGHTDENGHYDVAGLQTGKYRVCFYNSDTPYLDECYDDVPDWESATLVPVTEGETTAAIDATLDEGGHITGTITDGNGSPLPDIEVVVFNNGGGSQSSVNTDENGRYDVARLYTGDYKVCFYDLQGFYSAECYDDMPDRESATLVPVTVGETTTGIDAVLGDGGHITGTVTDSDGNPISGVEVGAYWYTPVSSQLQNYSYTDANGHYDVAGLQTRNYRISFFDWEGRYVMEYYDDASTHESATDVAVQVNQTTSGIDAVLTLGGHITGTVTDSDNDPISGIQVVAYSYTPQSYWEQRGVAETDANGQYDVGSLQTNTYRVAFYDRQGRYVSEYYHDAPYIQGATDVAVTVEQTTAGIDTVLEKDGHITGTVTDLAGNPAEAVQVVAHWYDPEWSEWEWSSPINYTDANGRYDIDGLYPGIYRVSFPDWQGRYVEEYYDNAATLESATDVLVTAGETTASIDALLSEGGHITGIVTAPAGNPLPDIHVYAFRYHAQFGDWISAGEALTDETGQYDLRVLQTDNYRVFFGERGLYVSEYYDNASTVESATDVAVEVDQITSGIDAVLDEAGQITGTVTDPNGNPLEGVDVYAYYYNQQDNYWEWAGEIYTDKSGQYKLLGFSGLHTGNYRVGFFDRQERYLSEYYLDAADIESAIDVFVTGGKTTPNIDASLNNGGHITGTITDSDGNPLSSIGILVQRYNSAQEWESAWWGAFTDSSGQYKTKQLHTGKYRVRFFAWNNQYLSEYYDNAPNFESATDITVIAEQTTAGIDAVLSLAYHIYLPLMNSSD